MQILAIDTTTSACSAAIWCDDKVVEQFDIAERGHARLILPMVDRLFSETDLSLNELDGICFAHGPGSFTGVRIASAVVQGLAYAANLPVVGISSLQVLAQAAFEEFALAKVAIAVDARMGQLYFGAYELQEQLMQPVIEDCLLDPDQVLLPKGTGFAAVGDGWIEYGDAIKNGAGIAWNEVNDKCVSHASYVAKLALPKFLAGATVDAAQALPVYLRGIEAWKPQARIVD